MPKISEKINELMEQTNEKIKDLEGEAKGEPFKDEEIKAITGNLKKVLALKKLQKEKGDDAELSEDEIEKNITENSSKEIFFSVISGSFDFKDCQFAVKHIDDLFETSEKINENHPEFEYFSKMGIFRNLFQKDPPDSHGKGINYTYERMAVYSIATMKMLNDHKDDIEKGTWTMEHFFSPDSLEERQKAFDAVWNKMQAKDRKQSGRKDIFKF